jgi:ribosomal small subunit protein bTHX
MGAGDARTRRGKINIGSYGNTRPHRPKKPATTPPKGGAKGKSR